MTQTKDAEKLNQFDDFLMIMDDQLEALERDGLQHGVNIHCNMDSLESLEQLFSKMKREIESNKINDLIVCFARYLGEIVIKSFGGHWRLHLEDEKNINYNRPVIIGHCSIPDLEFSPILLVRAYSIKEKQGMFRRAIEADIYPNPLDLSDLIEK